MTFSGLLPRFRSVAAVATLLPCIGCWEEVHYEPAPRAAAPVAVAVEENPTGNSSDATASTTHVATAPSGDELFADDLSGVDPGPPAPAATEPAPVADDANPFAGGATPVVNPAPPVAVAAPSAAERRAAWTLASNWSLVATQHTKEMDASQLKKYLAAARAAREAGDSLGIAAPSLPTGDSPAKLVAATIAELQTGAGPKLADAIAARLDEKAGAAARLAIRAHLLLLTYTQSGSTVWGDAADIRDAGVASGLPAELWRPLVEQLERRADFFVVGKAVIDFRNGVSAHLAE